MAVRDFKIDCVGVCAVDTVSAANFTVLFNSFKV